MLHHDLQRWQHHEADIADVRYGLLSKLGHKIGNVGLGFVIIHLGLNFHLPVVWPLHHLIVCICFDLNLFSFLLAVHHRVSDQIKLARAAVLALGALVQLRVVLGVVSRDVEACAALVLAVVALQVALAVQGGVLSPHNVAKRPFGISISERLYLFSRTPSGAPNGSPALTYKWTTQLLKEIAPPWPLDLSEGHGGGPGVVGDEQH